MTVVTATERKSGLGHLMGRAQREPVVVRKSGRDYAVSISRDEFDRFQELADRYWRERAEQGRRRGYLTADEASASVRRRLEAIEQRAE